MSTLSQLNAYSSTSSLLSATFGNTSKASSYSGLGSDLYSALSGYYSGSYGVNTADTSSSISNYLVGIKDGANKILNSLNNSSDKGQAYKFDVSSDNSSVSASYTGKELKDFTVDVKQLASSQKNEGDALKSNDKTSLAGSSGKTTTLTLTVNGKSTKIDVYAGPSASNLDVQNKLAQKINEANTGVNATVEKDEKTGTSQLVLTSSKTGAENGFSVSGELADALGITGVTEKAQNAIYSINSGADQVSSSNTVTASASTKDGATAEVSLTFNKTTDKSANLSSKAATTGGINAVRDLVNNFNALLDTAQGLKDSGASRLEKRLSSLSETYKTALSRVGITTNKDGFLEINEDKMKAAAESGELEKVFNTDANGYGNYGFVNKLSNLATSVENNPSSFLSLGANDENKFSTEARYQFDSNFSSYNSYKNYYASASMGMLFDALF